MAPRRGGIPPGGSGALSERRRRVLLAVSLVILFLGLGQVAAPALSQAVTVAIGAGPTRRSPPPSRPPTPPAPPSGAPSATGSSPGTAATTTPATTATTATTAGEATTTGPATPAPATVPTAGGVLEASSPAPSPTPASAVLVMPAIRPTTPGGYGCDAALAYLTANQAPGFTDVCAPAAAGPGRAGYTVADTQGNVTTGTIYISCPAPIVYQNETSNSWKFSGVAGVPLDPWGGVPVSQCRAGDIAPA